MFVANVKLNGEDLDRAYITHDEIVDGGELLFEMSKKPIDKVLKTPKPNTIY